MFQRGESINDLYAQFEPIEAEHGDIIERADYGG